jgi:hypothetical protein
MAIIRSKTWNIETCPFCKQSHVGTKKLVIANLRKVLKEYKIPDKKIKEITG